MKYEEIKRIVESYGEDFLYTGEMKQILRILKDSPSMQEQVEKGVTPEWLELVKTRQKVYIYHDSRKPSILSDDSKRYPYMEITVQEEVGHNGRPATKTPVLRYVTQQYKQIDTLADIARETERRMRLKKGFEER